LCHLTTGSPGHGEQPTLILESRATRDLNARYFPGKPLRGGRNREVMVARLRFRWNVLLLVHFTSQQQRY